MNSEIEDLFGMFDGHSFNNQYTSRLEQIKSLSDLFFFPFDFTHILVEFVTFLIQLLIGLCCVRFCFDIRYVVCVM